MTNVLSLTDLIAVAWFLFAWFGFNLLIDISPLRHKTLSHAMDNYRRAWMISMTRRPVRIMDTAITSGLQQGTAFFASTSLIAIGGGFALLNSTDVILQVATDLSLPVESSRALWEIKVLGLMLIFAYGFFKFGWAYRLFNYSSIVLGSVPEAGSPETEAIRKLAGTAAELNVLAGRHFNSGQRAFFFSIGFMGWFGGPIAFAVMTLAVLVVLLRRQFASRARMAVLSGHMLALSLSAEADEYTRTGSSNPFT